MPKDVPLSKDKTEREAADLFDAAVVFFETGDLETARELFERYLTENGVRSEEAREYLRRIGGELPRPSTRSTPRAVFPVASRGYHPEATVRGEPPSAVEEPQETLWRRPHLDVPGQPLAPGSQFQVIVYADQSDPAPGEQTGDILLSGPASQEEFNLDARLLVTPHFAILGDDLQPFPVARHRTETERVTYLVEVKPALELQSLTDAPPAVSAAFSYRGRPAGFVRRRIAIAGPTQAPANRADASQSVIHVESAARPTDLTVVIAAAAENDTRHFWCTVQTPHLEQFRDGVAQAWNLPDSTFNIVNGFMSEFTADGISKLMRIASLRGAGRKLYEAAPQNFKDALWQMIDAGRPPATIAVISSEPYIPWELMIPSRTAADGTTEKRRASLGVEFAVGRWTRKTLVAGSQSVPLLDSYVVAPKYSAADALPHAQEEAEFVEKAFSGAAISPATPDNIDAILGGGGRSLLHFACHGSSDPSGAQVLFLEGNQKLSAVAVCGLEGVETAFQLKKPLVFLNACEVGRLTPALVGVGGFAEAFIDLGARAVVAPLWSVKDEIAHEIAMTFYQTIKDEPETPFAEIVRRFRAKAYDIAVAEDSYAAYCFYGDPLASRA